MIEENWRGVPGHPLYEVSDRGRVRKYLNGSVNEYGYRQVQIGQDLRLVSRLVLEAFIGTSVGKQAAHLNGDSLDNRLSNLSWATQSENELHKRYHGTSLQGERSHRAKLTEADVVLIRRAAESGSTYAELADIFGVDRSNIRQVVLRKTWKHVV